MLAACSKENFVGMDNGEENLDGAVVVLPPLEEGDVNITRSTLWYAGGSGMNFSWENNELIGLYPIKTSGGELNSAQSTIQTYSITDISESGSSSIGHFYPKSQGVKALENEAMYVAYSKYNGNSEECYDQVSIDYRGQTQGRNELMGKYNNDNVAYLTSAKNATAHLGAKNFLVSSATASSEEAIYLKFSYMGATVRFFLSVPIGVVYDQMTVMNRDTKFFVAGKMDVKNKVFNDDGKVMSNTITLQFDSHASFNFSSAVAGSGDTYYPSKSSHMIVAYMEVAPVTLTTTSTLFLKGHTVDGYGNKVLDKYYKATLSTKTIQAGKVYQWTTGLVDDEPIKFEQIEVQEWEEGVKYNNEGAGTHTW